MSKVFKFHSADLALRGAAVNSTEVVREMMVKQKSFPLPTLALGQTLTAALLMATQQKDGQRVGLQFKPKGVLGWFYAEASFEGEVRGYCANPTADLRTSEGRLDMAGALGGGILSVSRHTPFQKQPQTGIVPLVAGDIGQNVAHYLFQSHQIPSVVSLTVSFDRDGQVTAAGGVLIELLPGATDSLVSTLETRARSAPSLSQEILAGKTPAQFAENYTHGAGLVAVEHPFPVVYSCRCEQERAQRAIAFLGKETVEEMVAKGADVGVTCEFCGAHYTVTLAELKDLLVPQPFISPGGDDVH